MTIKSIPASHTPQPLVAEFHNTYGLPICVEGPSDLEIDRRQLRLDLVLEETKELIEASGFCLTADNTIHINDEAEPNVVEMADALGDIVYVCYGMAIEMGINLDAVVAEIHRSNMSKLGEDGEPIINECKHYGGDKQPGFLAGYNPNVPEPVNYQLCLNRERFNKCDDPLHLIDPSNPLGKVLKGPNYFKPDIAKVIFSEGEES